MDSIRKLKLGQLSVKIYTEYFIGTLAFVIAKYFSKLNVDIVMRSSSRLPQRSLIYTPVRIQALKGSFLVQATDLLNSLSPPTFVPTDATRFKQSL